MTSNNNQLFDVIVQKAKEQFNEGLETASKLHDLVREKYEKEKPSTVLNGRIEFHKIFAKAIRDLKQE
jgi:hypothetical protein